MISNRQNFQDKKSELYMQRKILEKSSGQQQIVEIQKLYLPLERITNRQQEENKNILQVSLNGKLERKILQKLSDVENSNKKLLAISSKINNSTLIFSTEDKLHHLIFGIEEQMKSAFNDLIESIQEFYIDIDSKIKEIGSYLTSLSAMQTLQTTKQYHEDFHYTQHQSQKHKNQHQKSSHQFQDKQILKSINQKIQILQHDLDQTKSNQKKLMTIIDKLVSKYELTNETTMVREDPFLKNKIESLAKLEMNQHQSDNNCWNYNNFSGENSGKFVDGNTFAKSNANQPYLHQGYNINPGPVQQSNFQTSLNGKKLQRTQQIIPPPNPNDYSICHQLNKIQDLCHNEKQPYNMQRHKSTSSSSNELPMKKKETDNISSSTVSVQSYAYSNSMSQFQDQQCFIKKLYSKQPPYNKVSLKNGNQNTVFQINKPKEDQIDQKNKHHRQAFLLAQLKR